jgi:hypothetical protein
LFGNRISSIGALVEEISAPKLFDLFSLLPQPKKWEGGARTPKSKKLPASSINSENDVVEREKFYPIVGIVGGSANNWMRS